MRQFVLLAAFVCLPFVCHAQDDLDPVRMGQVLLQQGSRGAAVRALQRALTDVGHPLVADGAFGPRTKAGVRAFQTARSLLVDGVAGQQTVAALDRLRGRPQPTPQPAPPIGSVPPRAGGALSGSRFIADTWSLSRILREDRILQELQLGNLPDFLRSFRQVTITARDVNGRSHTVVLSVAPDYLAIGSDADFVRIPMGAPTAQRVADQFGCVLPTRKMVDSIYRAATIKLAPRPMTPSAAMMSNDYFARHQALVEQQWVAGGGVRGALTGGHKKDVVVSRRLERRPSRVAIYGWHLLSGNPIQPLSTVHASTYADYSHGVRLVHEAALVDGVPMRVVDVLSDPILHPLLSDEGRFTDPRVPTTPSLADPGRRRG